jgi:hypothetical protein
MNKSKLPALYQLKFVMLVGIVLIFSSCRTCEYPYEKLIVEEGLYPLENLNTEHNDYNAAPPPPDLSFNFSFIYSCDYYSDGDHYDFCVGSLWFYESEQDINFISNHEGKLTVEDINDSTSNELGPFFLIGNPRNTQLWYRNKDIYQSLEEDILIFSSNRLEDGGDPDDDYNIYFYSNEKVNPCSFNSNDDDTYSAYDYENNILYFCSTRSGEERYKIYRIVKEDTEVDFEAWLSDESLSTKIQLVVELDSDGNATCPYILDNIMVFASDRNGGYGGYDIYYSIFSNGIWSPPQNMGELVNSEADDFRPVLLNSNSDGETTENQGLLFSSNRPGGKGGFDLYFAVLKEDAL